MPRRTARPRARPRTLEGIDRLNAAVFVGLPPDWVADEAERWRSARQHAAWWLELRDEALAEGVDADHWTYRVVEVDERPATDTFMFDLAAEDMVHRGQLTQDEADAKRAGWIAEAQERDNELADLVREAWDELNAKS
jgi:hypothetical protein